MRIQLHNFQELAFLSQKRIVINAAGIQSGKTTVGAVWLTHRRCSIKKDDNLIICAPTYKILNQASIPKFMSMNKHLGKLHKVDAVFQYHKGPKIFIRSLSDPDAMEGIPDVEGIWLDEGGLISKYAWENVMGRAALREAQVQVTTTPYSLNWMYQLWKSWSRGDRDDVDFFSYSSKDNPYFPDSEYYRQKNLLDATRFAMKYDGIFGQMEGLVYTNVAWIKARELPIGTKYYGGIDWGYTNPFALVIRALTPDGIHYRVAEFVKRKMEMEDIIQICKSRQQMFNIQCFICDPSAPANLASLNRAGLKAIKGINDIAVGIDAHRQLMNEQRLYVFEDENPYGFDEYGRYHYPEEKDLKMDDDAKEQLPVAQDDHSLDADRYVTMHLRSTAEIYKRTPHNPQNDTKIPEDSLKRLEWLKKGGSNRNRNSG